MGYCLVQKAALQVDRCDIVVYHGVARHYREEFFILGSRLREHAFFPVRPGEVKERIACYRRVRVFARACDSDGPGCHFYPLIVLSGLQIGCAELIHCEVVFLRALQRGSPERYIVLPARIPQACCRRKRDGDDDKGRDDISTCAPVSRHAPQRDQEHRQNYPETECRQIEIPVGERGPAYARNIERGQYRQDDDGRREEVDVIYPFSGKEDEGKKDEGEGN